MEINNFKQGDKVITPDRGRGDVIALVDSLVWVRFGQNEAESYEWSDLDLFEEPKTPSERIAEICRSPTKLVHTGFTLAENAILDYLDEEWEKRRE